MSIPPSRMRAPRTEVSCGTGNAVDVICYEPSQLTGCVLWTGQDETSNSADVGGVPFILPQLGDIYRRSGPPNH